MARILIVDDEKPIRTLLASAFERAGYEVRTAEDGYDAVTICRAERFDAVLSDVMMPRMGGHDLAQWVASEYPRTKTILMSGFDLGCNDCPLAGRCQLLAKPFRPNEAVALVARVLEQRLAS